LVNDALFNLRMVCLNALEVFYELVFDVVDLKIYYRRFQVYRL